MMQFPSCSWNWFVVEGERCILVCILTVLSVKHSFVSFIPVGLRLVGDPESNYTQDLYMHIYTQTYPNIPKKYTLLIQRLSWPKAPSLPINVSVSGALSTPGCSHAKALSLLQSLHGTQSFVLCSIKFSHTIDDFGGTVFSHILFIFFFFLLNFI